MHQEHLEKERLDAIIKMAGAVCHEMAQPVQALNGYIDLLKIDLQKYATIDHINKIGEQIERISLLLGKIGSIRHYKTKPYLREEIIDIDASSSSKPTTIA
ncbi:hypothetical protein LCGC14_2490370 [marine sediment metagenome]|uniref:Signal transduction histidine kinase dimerisation/phosphoacceptor domain-containing protein n=1 Tax=marine sediment metagenome TaxID=412755 RepID=A0A0F9BST0_9ZZZZ